MESIKRFEDLKCWQAARLLAKTVYAMTKNGPLAKDFDLRSQLQSAAVSAMSNIAEGFGRFSDREFVRFLEMSQSSSQEVRSLSYVIEDQCYVELNESECLRERAEASKSLTLGLIRYIKSKGKRA